MGQARNTTIAILQALGYTPATLAADINITISKARRILRPDGFIRTDEFSSVVRLTGISPDILGGFFVPGAAGREATPKMTLLLGGKSHRYCAEPQKQESRK